MSVAGRLFQIMERLIPGDGVSNMARDFAPVLAELGAEPRIVTLHADPAVRDETVPFDTIRFRADDTVIVHVWGPTALEAFLRGFGGRKVVYFQNVTPPGFFASGSVFERMTRAGLAQLSRLVDLVHAWVAPSAYSLRTLAGLGLTPRATFVVPPVIETMEARGIDPDPATLARLRARDEVNVLFVGRVAPNKMHERVMEVFEHFHTRLERRSRLHLVGDTTDHPEYVARLRALAARLPSGATIEMPGKVSEAVLAAYYRAADLFLCLSEHEGFGLPPLVAAAHGIPVMARAASALEETVGPAGILLDRCDARRIAELAHVVVHDGSLRERLARAAGAYLQGMTRPAVRDAWASALVGIVPA